MHTRIENFWYAGRHFACILGTRADLTELDASELKIEAFFAVYLKN